MNWQKQNPTIQAYRILMEAVLGMVWSAGETIKEFAEAAFAIKEKLEIFPNLSKLAAGWHIIRLIDKKAPPSFEEAKTFILKASSCARRSLSQAQRSSYRNRLKSEYGYEIDLGFGTMVCKQQRHACHQRI